MQVTLEDRRRLMATVCEVAWADGVITDEEREAVTALCARLGHPVPDGELEAWLRDGVPELSGPGLPEELEQLALYESMRVMEADGEVDDRELALVESLLERVRAQRS